MIFMALLINGKVLSKVREEKLKIEVAKLGFTPKVVSIVIGQDPPSLLYTKMKQKKAADVGINFSRDALGVKFGVRCNFASNDKKPV